MDRPFLLLSTPRSGSTPVYRILARYLELNFRTYGVEELLNPFYGSYREVKGLLECTPSANSPDAAEWTESFAHRLKLAKKHHGRIFLKAFPSAFRPESTEWLIKSHRIVCHERINAFEQALSYVVSSETRRWYEDDGLVIAAKSLKAQRHHFKQIEGILFHYHQLKAQLQVEATFTYEDFLRSTGHQLLLDRGFNGEYQDLGPRQTRRQNLRPKLELFMNRSEIMRWYRDSFLQQISPLAQE